VLGLSVFDLEALLLCASYFVLCASYVRMSEQT
jgi:hypothetical protein